ncbi:MAG: two pore domain potassium channel family protein [Acidobacteria bacterium]|nr:MAG: two pore domain potassium channel family protein [Acidobacteriota bacterium]
MTALAILAGFVIILAVLLDAFETVVLPRRVQRSFRLTSWFYRHTWVPWVKLSQAIGNPGRREAFLSYFGPLSLILLLVVWAVGLIFGFALVQYGLGGHLHLGNQPIRFGALLYHSGETFFTLGYGDIVPISWPARLLAVCEAGMGFAFLGVVIGYLPTVYSSFSDRELEISLLDSRAGSPPSASELLNRLGCCPDQSVLDRVFRDWERWAAEVLESHLSYPVLSFFRSQHSNQSWLGTLTLMLDVTSLVIAGIESLHPDQARLTFAMARHAAVDLAQVVNARYDPNGHTRLSSEDLEQLRNALAANGLKLRRDETATQKLSNLRSLYEPYVEGMARNLIITLPPWIRTQRKKDNWQGGPWDKAIQRKGLEDAPRIDEHF